jgi:hypothetical protein
VVETTSYLLALGLLVRARTCLGASPLKVVIFFAVGIVVYGILSLIIFNCFLEVVFYVDARLVNPNLLLTMETGDCFL